MVKNKFAAAIVAITVLLFTVGCDKAKENGSSNTGVVEIKEKMFATQVNDVYVNAKDYLGKTIKLEGVFKSEQYNIGVPPYCYVVRYGPGGCCGIDANVGFEVRWDRTRSRPYPAAESWVEAEGELKLDEKDYYLYLDLASLTVLNTRGREFVAQ